jgi:DNA-binding transcriptional LysR family regulator
MRFACLCVQYHFGDGLIRFPYTLGMDLRRLQYFVAVAEELSFRRAAERLQMTQPPLSSQIQQLEKELEVKLFDRTGRGLRLTEAGRFLLEDACRLLIQVRQTADMTRRIGHGRVGRPTIGFLPSIGHGPLPDVLREFRAHFPEVDLLLRELNPDQQVQALHDKRVDVGFLYLPLEDSALSIEPVFREPLIVALPEQHPLADKPQVPLYALSDEPFILPPQHRVPGCYGQIMKACHQAGFSPKAVQKDVWLMQTTVDLVAAGIGVALVAGTLRNLSRAGVVYKTLQDPSPVVEIGVVWRCGDDRPVLRSFLDMVDKTATSRQLERSLSAPGSKGIAPFTATSPR